MGFTAPVKNWIKQRTPKSVLLAGRLLWTGDGGAVISLLRDSRIQLSLAKRVELVKRFYRISRGIHCEHAESEMLTIASTILRLDAEVPGSIVEAGCFKGGSTAKLSILAQLTNRFLVTFDSFEGIPENSEDHGKNIWGGDVAFHGGDYAGSLAEVTRNVTRYGAIGNVRFVKGYFEETMSGFSEPIAAAYIDVDLASSTRTCLRCIWPLLSPGGVIFSQDGHLPLVLEVLTDRAFWKDELQSEPPQIVGLGRQPLIWFTKPVARVEQGASKAPAMAQEAALGE